MVGRVDQCASAGQLCRLPLWRCGNGVNLDLFQYMSSDQRTEGPENSDVGGHHLAFYVDDINAAIARLRAHGVRVLDKPIMVTEEPTAGLTWIYFLAPWGMNLGLVSCENGIAHDKSGKTLLWEPKTPGEPRSTPTDGFFARMVPKRPLRVREAGCM